MAAKRELKNVSPLIADNAQITLIPKRKRQRVWEIDFLRGVCVILMILDHLTILISDIFGPQWYGGYNRGDAFTKFCFQWYNGSAREIIHPLVLFVFFSISGISCTFSRNNAKRGLMLGAVALLYTLGSYIAQNVMGISGVFVAFGVLDFLAVSMLLYAFVSFITRDNRWGIAGASVILIVVTLVLYFCYTPPETTPKFFAWIFPPHDFYGNPSLFLQRIRVFSRRFVYDDTLHRVLFYRCAYRRIVLLRKIVARSIRAHEISLQKDLRRVVRQRTKRKESVARVFNLHSSFASWHAESRKSGCHGRSKIRLFRRQTRPYHLRRSRRASCRSALLDHRSFHNPRRFRLLRKMNKSRHCGNGIACVQATPRATLGLLFC